MIFGIGTSAANNYYASVTALTISSGYISTTFPNTVLKSYLHSFLDTGSNGLYFEPASNGLLPFCTRYLGFYCPTGPLPLPVPTSGVAQLTGGGGTKTLASPAFNIANAEGLTFTNAAEPQLGGPLGVVRSNGNGGVSYTPPADTTIFDWGLPFFYGKTVIIGFTGLTVPAATGALSGKTGPFYAL